jgi:tetratricopeptide (TPR) repeat protein
MKTVFIFIWSFLLTSYGFCQADSPQQNYENALLFREFHRAAARVELDYYNWLTTRGNTPEHQYAHYYVGIAYTELEAWQQAVESFEHFIQLKDIPATDRAVAEIRAGFCYYQQGEEHHTTARTLWEKHAASEKPKVKSALGYAYARANIHPVQALDLCQNTDDTDEAKRNLGYVLLRRGELDNAGQLLEQLDFTAAERVLENSSESEQRERFYFFDPAIFAHLSELYLLRAAEAQTTLDNAFAVGQARYELGRYDDALAAFSMIPNDNFASAQQQLESIANALTWMSDKKRRQWRNQQSPQLETKNIRALAAALTSLSAQIEYQQNIIRIFDPNDDPYTQQERLRYISEEISWESRKARKSWLSERQKEIKAKNMDAIVAALDARTSNYENAQQRIQQAKGYFYSLLQAPVWLGACHLKLGNSKDALTTWSEAKARYAESPDFWSELGLVFSQLIADSDNTTVVHRIAGRLLENSRTGDFPRAFCEKSLDLLEYDTTDIGGNIVAPIDRKYFRNFGYVLKTSGDEEGALKALKKGRDEKAWNSLEKNGALFFAQIAQCYYPFKEFREIMEIWKEIKENYSESYQILHTMRLISIIKGKGQPGAVPSG